MDSQTQLSPACPQILPRDLHPAHTEERLRTCARLLANARRDAIALARLHSLIDRLKQPCPRTIGLLAGCQTSCQ